MTRTVAGMALALGLISACPTWAAPPTITATTPFGVRRGVAAEVKIDGTNLKGTPELVAPFGVKFATPTATATNADAAHWKFTLEVDPDTAVGVYPIRVKT